MEDHVFSDCIACFFHGVFETGQTLKRVTEIISSCNESDIVAFDFADDILRDFIHDLPVVRNHRIKPGFFGTYAYDRRKIRSGGEVLEKLIIQSGMMECIRTNDNTVVIRIIRKRKDLFQTFCMKRVFTWDRTVTENIYTMAALDRTFLYGQNEFR